VQLQVVEELESRTLPSVNPILAIACGQTSAPAGWSADEDYSGGSTYATTQAISTSGVVNAAPASVFQNERYGTNFTYSLSQGLAAGQTYDVRLDFSENVANAANQRPFNVAINGTTVVYAFDIWSQAGGHQYTAVAEEFQAVANSSGQIVINFTSATSNAKVDGIEVYSESQSALLAISSGNTTSPGSGWSADEDYSQGGSYTSSQQTYTTSTVIDPAPATVYQKERYGTNFTYTLPGLAAGQTYDVRLDFSENVANAANQRPFNVAINGTTVVYAFDIWSQAGGHQYTAVAEEFQAVANSSGQIVINFTSATSNAKVDGIRLFSIGQDWFSQNLPDAGLQGLARTDFTRDGSITYSDMVGLLNQVISETGTGTVSSAVFTSLQALVSGSGASYLQEAPDVQNLGYKLVNGDPSNAYYQGTIALSNLQVGSTATQLQELTDKWFLGMDHPELDYQDYGGSISYNPASGTLFYSSTGTPSYKDVWQGAEGDCWLLSSFTVTANSDPTIIESQFIYEGTALENGVQAQVWSVRFYNNGVAQYVTVDNFLPTTSSGQFIYANYGGSTYTNSNTVLWPALDEKAYAQLCASGWNERSESNAYASLNGGYASTSLPIITNGTQSTTNVLATQTSFINAIAANTLLTLATGAGNSSLGIVGNHDYGVIGYNSTNQTFTLLNPWGWNNTSAPGILNLTYAQVMANFSLDGNANVAGAALSSGLQLDRLASADLADSSVPAAPEDGVRWANPAAPVAGTSPSRLPNSRLRSPS